MWSVTVGENGAGTVEFLSDLARHTRAVNTVRFSPDGETLATGDDGFYPHLWLFYHMVVKNKFFSLRGSHHLVDTQTKI